MDRPGFEGSAASDGERPERLDALARLETLIGAGLPLHRFFAIALPLVEALERLHGRRLMHGGLRPRHILVGDADPPPADTAVDARRPRVHIVGADAATGRTSAARRSCRRRSRTACWPTWPPNRPGA